MSFRLAPLLLLLLLSACGWEARSVVTRATSVPPPPPVHVVVQGDTLSELAELYRIPMAEIAALNGLTEPFTIRIGQVLRLLPAETASSSVRPDASSRTDPTSVAPTAPQSAETSARLPPRRPARADEIQTPSQPTPVVPDPSTVATPAAAEGDGSTTDRIVRPPPVPTRQNPSASDGIPRDAESAVSPSQAEPQFAWPVAGEVIERFSSSNSGIDIAASLGAVVRSSEGGIVAYADDELAGFGNLVLVRHTGNWVTAYAHLDRILVRVGDEVALGGIIGTVGNSGADRVALHFELRQGRDPVDPLGKLPAR